MRASGSISQSTESLLFPSKVFDEKYPIGGTFKNEQIPSSLIQVRQKGTFLHSSTIIDPTSNHEILEKGQYVVNLFIFGAKKKVLLEKISELRQILCLHSLKIWKSHQSHEDSL